MAHAADSDLHLDDGRIYRFSSHWAACAAMIRQRDPAFVSSGGDREADLLVEAKIASDDQERTVDSWKSWQYAVAACRVSLIAEREGRSLTHAELIEATDRLLEEVPA